MLFGLVCESKSVVEMRVEMRVMQRLNTRVRANKRMIVRCLVGVWQTRRQAEMAIDVLNEQVKELQAHNEHLQQQLSSSQSKVMRLPLCGYDTLVLWA